MSRGELHVELQVNYADDDKLSDVSPLARLLYVDALCLCKRVMNDGVITAAHLRKLAYWTSESGARKLAAELVATGAWQHDPETGRYTCSAWLKRNPSRSEVEEEMARRHDLQGRKGSLGNHTRWHSRRGISVADCEHCESPGDRRLRSDSESSGIPNDRLEIETEIEIGKELPARRRGRVPKSRAYTEAFETFWAAYGRKGSKADAFAEWQRAVKRAAPDVILAAVAPYLASKPDPQWRKDAERWLKGDCWESTLPAAELPPDRDGWLKAEWKAGRTRPIMERTGLVCPLAEIPFGVDTPEDRERYLIDHARTWITENRALILERMSLRSVS